MGKQVIIDTRFVIKSKNTEAIKSLIEDRMDKECHKTYSSAIESILMEFINTQKAKKKG